MFIYVKISAALMYKMAGIEVPKTPSLLFPIHTDIHPVNVAVLKTPKHYILYHWRLHDYSVPAGSLLTVDSIQYHSRSEDHEDLHSHPGERHHEGPHR